MTSMIISSVILFLCCMLIAQCSDSNNRKTLLKFLSVVKGKFDNIEQHQSSNGITDRFQVRIQTVYAPVLKAPVIYLEGARNGKVELKLVAEVTYRQADNTIRLQLYKVTDARQYKPNEFNTTNLANYKIKDFEPYGNCPIIARRFYPDVYATTWSDCRDNLSLTQTEYYASVYCGTVTFSTTLSTYNTSELFILKRLDESKEEPGACIASQ